MFPLLEVGPLIVPVAGLVLLAGLWLGLEAGERTAPHFGVPAHDIYGLALSALLLAFVGARVGYVLRYLEGYLRDPRAIFFVNSATMDITAGALVGLLVSLAYLRWRRLPLRRTLDSLAPGLAVFAVALGVAHLANGVAFGAPADLPWAIELWDARRHPSQVYETGAGLAILLTIWRLRRLNPFPGFLFTFWLALAAAARLFLEAFRGDSVVVAGTVRQAQLGALLIILLSLWLMGRWARLGAPIGHSHPPA